VDDLTRRAFLATGGAFAAAWLIAPADKLAETARYVANVRLDAPPPFANLTADEAADLDAAMSAIIPTDDTPGAHEARCVYFVDQALGTWAKDQAPAIRAGIAELRKRAAQGGGSTQAGAPANANAAATFAALGADQRHDVIAALEKDQHPFFNNLRGATITGWLASPEHGGNYNKVGWKSIGFIDQFSWAPPFGWYDAHPNG
jgi:HAMP domain-containing protein